MGGGVLGLGGGGVFGFGGGVLGLGGSGGVFGFVGGGDGVAEIKEINFHSIIHALTT